MKLLIIGATGPTGRELVNQALAQGHEVTALVRDTTKVAFASQVKMMMGDVLNGPAFAKASARQISFGGERNLVPGVGVEPTRYRYR